MSSIIWIFDFFPQCCIIFSVRFCTKHPPSPAGVELAVALWRCTGSAWGSSSSFLFSESCYRWRCAWWGALCRCWQDRDFCSLLVWWVSLWFPESVLSAQWFLLFQSLQFSALKSPFDSLWLLGFFGCSCCVICFEHVEALLSRLPQDLAREPSLASLFPFSVIFLVLGVTRAV